MELTGFQKSTIFKICWLVIKHHFGCSNEEKDFWIIDWFLTVDLVYLIPPNDIFVVVQHALNLLCDSK
jgi:hypothetical protein